MSNETEDEKQERFQRTKHRTWDEQKKELSNIEAPWDPNFGFFKRCPRCGKWIHPEAGSCKCAGTTFR